MVLRRLCRNVGQLFPSFEKKGNVLKLKIIAISIIFRHINRFDGAIKV